MIILARKTGVVRSLRNSKGDRHDGICPLIPGLRSLRQEDHKFLGQCGLCSGFKTNLNNSETPYLKKKKNTEIAKALASILMCPNSIQYNRPFSCLWLIKFSIVLFWCRYFDYCHAKQKGSSIHWDEYSQAYTHSIHTYLLSQIIKRLFISELLSTNFKCNEVQ